MITCPKCSKDNQDHYKFCLGCGAELPRDAHPKPFAANTPPHGMKAAQPAAGALGAGMPGMGATVAAPPAAAPAAPAYRASSASHPSHPSHPSHGAQLGAVTGPLGQVGVPQAAPVQAAAPVVAPPQAQQAVGAQTGSGGGTVICPQCGHVNGPSNTFCGSCGFRLGGQPGVSRIPPPVAAGGDLGGVIVLTALRADGSEAGTYHLPSATTTVGRDTGSIFAGDSYLSPRHATFRQPTPGRLVVKDEGSLNGVYKKLARDVPVELKPNDVFRIGQEIIRFEPLSPQPPSADGVERLGAPSKGYVGRIALIIGRDATGNAFPVPEAGVHLGRERGDVLFPEDGYVSGLHCRLAWENGRGLLTDLGSSNGTFVRIKEETDVRTGDVLLMGQQLFRITM